MAESRFSSTMQASTSSSSSIMARNAMMNAKLNVETFDGIGHFGMWQSEIIDALFNQSLDIAIEEEKSEDIEEKEWRMLNSLACGTIRSCLSRKQKYVFSKETSANKLWTGLEEKFLKKNCQNRLKMKKHLFRFTYVPGTTLNDHITNLNQLITDLMNFDVTFEDEDLALMLLGSLFEEFEHLETTLLHGKVEVSLSEVSSAMYSYELRRKDKQSSRDGAAEALKGHWKKDCPKLKSRPDKEKAVADSNITECIDQDSDFSLAVMPTGHSSTWLLDSELKKNLISVGVLESIDYKVSAYNRVMKIISGALVLVKGIRKNNNLYYYQDNTVVGVTAVASSDDRELKVARLWHMRLGHAGEKFLNLLMNQGLLKGATVCKLDFCEHCVKGK
ncbi:uncharacterized protein LOC113780174 [Coffea eugenioides]|uniref:uncharacterized protein LOC113780174 n=1 Tax=Coffea eugenioides TaxID=49369 RepID=UPI000F60FC8C|nr:uncharacterized protein LOC113780174 [Coffea eugenioides]